VADTRDTITSLLPAGDQTAQSIAAFASGYYGGASSTQIDALIAAVRARPKAEVVSQLNNAFNATLDPLLMHVLVSTAVIWGEPEGLTVFANALAPAKAALVPQQRSKEDRLRGRYGQVAGAALRGVYWLTKSQVPGASNLLLDTAISHPDAAVRGVAISWARRLPQPQFASLIATLQAGLSASDLPILSTPMLTPEQLQAAIPVLALGTSDPSKPALLPIPTVAVPAGTGPIALPVPTVTDTTSGNGGPGGTCTEANAVDLGAPGNNVTVWANGCVRVKNQYPSWWGTARKMRLEDTTPGSYPVPFTWTNSCANSGGNGTYTGDWQAFNLVNTNANCATVIDLLGSSTGKLTLRYWGN
jgi:hypothetical protein